MCVTPCFGVLCYPCGVTHCRLGEVAEEGEVELVSKVLGSAPLTTRARIRRDRELHRLGLNLVERIPKDVLTDLVQVGLHKQGPVNVTLVKGRAHGLAVRWLFFPMGGFKEDGS